MSSEDTQFEDTQFLYASSAIYSTREETGWVPGRSAMNVKMENNKRLVEQFTDFIPPRTIILNDPLMHLAEMYKPKGLEFSITVRNADDEEKLYKNFGKSSVWVSGFSGPLRTRELGHDGHLSIRFFSYEGESLGVDIDDFIAVMRSCKTVHFSHRVLFHAAETFRNNGKLDLLKRLVSSIQDQAFQQLLDVHLNLQVTLSQNEKNMLHEHCRSISSPGAYELDENDEDDDGTTKSKIIVSVGGVSFLQNHTQRITMWTDESNEIRIYVSIPMSVQMAGRTAYNNQAPVRVEQRTPWTV